MQDDRRKYIRYDIPLEVEFKPLENASEFLSGLTLNFSRSGICFSSSFKAPRLNEVLDLRVKRPDEDTFVSAIGDLVWKEESSKECFYGVNLMSMEAEAKSIILETAYNRWLDLMRDRQ